MNKVFLFADYSQAEARVVAWAGPIPAMRTWFTTGEDIHLNVAKMIGKIAQEAKLEMPVVKNKKGERVRLWSTKHWTELVKDDPERQLAKNTVHGNNYDMGPIKFAYITGLPVKHAGLVQEIYHRLFPEIRGNYHRWINEQLARTRTLVNPIGWPRIFYDLPGPELSRAAYAWYPQSTIGLLTIRTLCEVCEVFTREFPDTTILTPARIKSMGYDVQLQVHDSVGVVLDDDPSLIREVALTIKRLGEYPLMIKGEELIVPMDFKIGPTWGEQRDYKLVV